MENTIRLIGYNQCSLNEGIGLREVCYIAKCTHKCLGCHNERYWEDEGCGYDIDDVVSKLTKNPHTDITISGGDGLTIQYENTLELLKRLKEKSNKNIWIYTGYTWEQLFELGKAEVLKYVDVVVDGRFELSERDVTLKFRGSKSQRIIDVKESLKENKVVEVGLY
ncbi:MAG: anaerobic ribonucleoside-triphosphate reductase activating protein [Clostridium sp.]|uniref:anaerobic ribonucleoside-triphosphate reductase activating protein n=1 Tax=Clostridium sp. TaxID=1506 RepID=UPI003038B94A